MIGRNANLFSQGLLSCQTSEDFTFVFFLNLPHVMLTPLREGLAGAGCLL
eukprot:m.156785 g.156785  ORF g.156785 m.156785 type:complete len:50 (+) comp24699_c0_seq10:177-326(+)